jgi:hypothetical protein
MHEHAGGLGEGAKVQYIADVLKELRRLSNPYELLSYLIEMAEVEAAKTAKYQAMSIVVNATSESAQSRLEPNER